MADPISLSIAACVLTGLGAIAPVAVGVHEHRKHKKARKEAKAAQLQYQHQQHQYQQLPFQQTPTQRPHCQQPHGVPQIIYVKDGQGALYALPGGEIAAVRFSDGAISTRPLDPYHEQYQQDSRHVDMARLLLLAQAMQQSSVLPMITQEKGHEVAGLPPAYTAVDRVKRKRSL